MELSIAGFATGLDYGPNGKNLHSTSRHPGYQFHCIFVLELLNAHMGIGRARLGGLRENAG
jgi:hypothetical protein